MTTVRDEQSLSRLELVVLARLSLDKPTSKPPSETKLAMEIANLASPAVPGTPALVMTADTLPHLRRNGLLNGCRLTELGKRALRKALALDVTPTWTEVRTAHLGALGLGLQPGSADAAAALATGESLLAHIACTQLGLARKATLSAVCDDLIRQAFGIPDGQLTLRRIRAYALANKNKEPVAAGLPESPRGVASGIARTKLGVPLGHKLTMVQALTRRWLYEAVTPTTTREPTTTPRATSAQAALPLTAPPTTTPPPNPPRAPLVAQSADTLLTLVREAIPSIGSDGRFGTEKVFVSAIWHRIERDSRLPDLSLDRFKRWLVSANRDQLLDLARADLVGAMDPALVRESEIEDLGATFHFVVDRRANGAGQGHHAR